MKLIQPFLVLFTAMLALASCQKEHSLENGAGKIDTLRDDCAIQQFLEADSASGRVENAYISVYDNDSTQIVSEIRLVDSTRNTIENIFPITHTVNRVQVNALEYFLKGTDGRVTEFHGYENLRNPSIYDKITAKYTYNAAGFLVKRAVEFDSIPGITAYEVDYTYTGNNLTKADLKVRNGTALQSAASVTYEYDASKTVKNFLYFQAFASEIMSYQTAVNLGSRSTNSVTRTTFIYPNPITNQLTTNVSRFINYTIDARGYVQSFYVTGDDFFISELYSGYKYVLRYHCI